MLTLIAISTKTHIYKSKPFDVKESQYTIKNKSINTKPIMISIKLDDLKIKKNGKIQKTIHA